MATPDRKMNRSRALLRMESAAKTYPNSSRSPEPEMPSEPCEPVQVMTSSAFEQLLASAPPPELLRTSARPTIPLGPVAVLVTLPPTLFLDVLGDDDAKDD